MLGLQLYTVRHKIKDAASAEDVLTKIKEFGYECVQLASSIENMEFTAEICKDIGLPVVGLLCNIDMCEEDGEKLFEMYS